MKIQELLLHPSLEDVDWKGKAFGILCREEGDVK